MNKRKRLQWKMAAIPVCIILTFFIAPRTYRFRKEYQAGKKQESLYCTGDFKKYAEKFAPLYSGEDADLETFVSCDRNSFWTAALLFSYHTYGAESEVESIRIEDARRENGGNAMSAGLVFHVCDPQREKIQERYTGVYYRGNYVIL